MFYMKRMLTILCIALCVVLLLGGCGSVKPVQDNVAHEPVPENVTNGSEEQPVSAEELEVSGRYGNIMDFSNAWRDLRYSHDEPAELEDSVYLVLCGGDLGILAHYDALNEYNKNGRFEGEHRFRYQGFIEKKDSELEFGYEFTEGAGKNADIEWPLLWPGDKCVEKGSCDLGNGYLEAERFAIRDEVCIFHVCNEFKVVKEGEMVALVMEGDSTRKKEPWTTCVYMKLDKEKMDYALGESAMGADFEKLIIADKGVLTKEEVAKMMMDAGFAIKETGSMVHGKLTID